MKLSNQLKERFENFRKKALIIGLMGAALSCVGFIISKQAFSSSYLIAYIFWTGLTIGSLPMIFIHHLTAGQWGYPIRRPLEIVSLLSVFCLVAFVPILFCMKELYPWTNAEIVAHDVILQGKASYLNVPFFFVRYLFYFAVWIGLGFLLNRWSLQYDESPTKAVFGKMQAAGGIGMVLYGFTVTFSSVDWVMSTEPHWFSTIYGFLFMIGQTLSGLGFVTLFVIWFSKYEPFKSGMNQKRSHDIGNLIFALVLLWAYISLSQFIIIWSGNLQEEAPWYLKRSTLGWNAVAMFLVFFHFFVPFLALLQRKVKRSFSYLAKVIVLLLFMRYVDLFWIVKPVFSESFNIHWTDLTAFIGLGGLWMAAFFHLALRKPLSFIHDPIEEENH